MIAPTDTAEYPNGAQISKLPLTRRGDQRSPAQCAAVRLTEAQLRLHHAVTSSVTDGLHPVRGGTGFHLLSATKAPPRGAMKSTLRWVKSAAQMKSSLRADEIAAAILVDFIKPHGNRTHKVLGDVFLAILR